VASPTSSSSNSASSVWSKIHITVILTLIAWLVVITFSYGQHVSQLDAATKDIERLNNLGPDGLEHRLASIEEQLKEIRGEQFKLWEVLTRVDKNVK
jgi:hypothetical protein